MNSHRRQALLPKEETNVNGFKIPKDLGTLNRLFDSAKNIHDLTKSYLASGSHVTQQQFIGLRVIIPEPIDATRFEGYLDVFGLSSVWHPARQLVEESTEFSALIHLIANNIPVTGVYDNDQNFPGSFKPAQRALEQVKKQYTRPTQAPQPQTSWSRVSSSEGTQPGKVQKPRLRRTMLSTLTRKSGKELVNEQQGYHFGSEESADSAYVEGKEETADEVTPNTAIILLLQSITDLAKNSMVEWTFDHIKLKATFRNGHYNAWTDGALRQASSGNILAIVEAKKHRRENKAENTMMQEAAEAAAWVLSQDHKLPALNGQ
jgi:hypothetical protein